MRASGCILQRNSTMQTPHTPSARPEDDNRERGGGGQCPSAHLQTLLGVSLEHEVLLLVVGRDGGEDGGGGGGSHQGSLPAGHHAQGREQVQGGLGDGQGAGLHSEEGRGEPRGTMGMGRSRERDGGMRWGPTQRWGGGGSDCERQACMRPWRGALTVTPLQGDRGPELGPLPCTIAANNEEEGEEELRTAASRGNLPWR